MARWGEREARLNLITPLLSLVAAASWGAGDFAGGIATRLSNTLVAVLMAQSVGVALSAVLLLLSHETAPGGAALGWAALAGISGSAGLGAFYLALSRGTMGLVAPLTALLAAAWPAAFALLGGAAVSVLTLAGMGVALSAVVLISLPDRRLGSPVMPTYHGSRLREWLLVVAASLGFGGFFLLIDASHDAGGEVWWPLFTVKAAGVSVVVSVALLLGLWGRSPGIRAARAAVMVASLAGVGDLGGNLFFVLASAEGELAVVVVLTSLYPVSTALLARLFLHERLGPVRAAGVALAVLGVVLISLG